VVAVFPVPVCTVNLERHNSCSVLEHASECYSFDSISSNIPPDSEQRGQ